LHPTIESILRGEAEALAHAAACPSCSSVAALSAPASAPRAVDHDLAELPVIDRALYTDVRELERGGMGRTSSARDRRLGRRVAIKELRDDAGDPAVLARRLEQEARLTARLQHPSIVGVYEAGRWANGDPFYAMPLVRGRPLDAELRGSRALGDRLRLVPHVIAACEAIAYAHGEGVIHRDLKPANVMIGEYGETVVIDWGLAKVVGEPDVAGPERQDDLTRLGVGTPQYMPPEQARGESPTPVTDVYALGATLYHVLAGVPPYGIGDGSELRRRLLDGPPQPLRELVLDVPAALAAIVDKAMAREPGARFTTARELAAELGRFQTGQLTLTHQYTLGELVRRFVRRHRAAVAIATLALTALAIGAVVATRQISRQRDRATAGEQQARLALADSQGARASLLAASPETRLAAVELAIAAADRAPQGLFDAVTAGPVLVSLGGAVNDGWWSPSGDRFATTDGARAIRIRDRDGTTIAELTSALSHAYWVAWSPDARAIAVTGVDSAVELWDVGARSTQRLAMPAKTELVRYLPDGTLVAAAIDGTVRAWRGTQLVGETALRCTPSDMAVSGHVLWTGCTDGTIVAWDTTHAVRTSQPEPVTAVAADATGVYTGSPTGVVRTWSADGSGHELWRSPDPNIVYAIHVAPKWLGIAVGRMRFIGRDGGDLGEEDFELAVQPLPAAARIAAAINSAHMIGVVDMAHHEVVARMRGHKPFARAIAVGAADGQRMLSITTSGEAWLWDTRMGALAGALPDHDGEVVAVAVSGDRATTLALGGRVHEASLADGALVHSEPGVAIASAASDGTSIIAGGADGTVRMFGAAPRKFAVGHAPVTAVVLAADRAAAGDADGTIVDAAGARYAVPDDPVTALAFAGGSLASGHASGTVRVWPGDRRFDGAAVTGLVASGDGHSLAIGRGDGGELVDLATGHRQPLPGRPLAWSTSRGLALAAPTGALWLRSTSGAMHALAGHEHAITAAVFAGDTLWTGDAAGEIRGWPLRGDPIAFPGRGLGAVTALTPGPEWVIAGFADGSVRVLPATLAAARTRACTTLAAFGRASESCTRPR
jgi:WD40 repeat protein